MIRIAAIALCLWASMPQAHAEMVNVIECKGGFMSPDGPFRCHTVARPYTAPQVPAYVGNVHSDHEWIEWQVPQPRHYTYCQFIAQGQFVCQ